MSARLMIATALGCLRGDDWRTLGNERGGDVVHPVLVDVDARQRAQSHQG